MADDSTSPEKDGFAPGEAITWKFEDLGGNQFDLTPSPDATFSINGISFITGMSYSPISCGNEIEGCTDSAYLEYNANAK